jgi:ferredoxin
MNIEVDRERCEANGVCVGMAPDVFDLDDQDSLVISVAHVVAARESELSQIAASCPVAALTVS